jgi:putative ABC transport system permease protein
MIAYNLRLAWLSMRRNPILTTLMALAIAFGIAACTMMITSYHRSSGNPIWWKNGQLYAVTLDLKSADPKEREPNDRHWNDPPPQLTYRDALALFDSAIPTRKVMMYKTQRTLDPGVAGMKPFSILVRLTTADFFSMFDVPFRYGGGWTPAADAGPEPVAVLSKRTNDRVFAGGNSVGKSINLNGHSYRVLGVLDAWLPNPKFYDLNNSGFLPPEDVYLPFRWGPTLELGTAGNTNCVQRQSLTVKSFQELLNSDCIWLQFWAELPDHERLQRFQQFADSYVLEQKKLGRFPRPLNNRLENVQTWLTTNEVVAPETRILLILAFMFLAVCLLNTIGLMLAKGLAASPSVALRRALGASRADILRQHLIEVMAIGLAGGLSGLLLAAIGMAIERRFIVPAAAGSDNPELTANIASLSHIDATVVVMIVGLSLLAGLAAGLYPAWRICRVAPATYLKTQ